MLDFKHALNTFVTYKDLYREYRDKYKTLDIIWEAFEDSDTLTYDNKNWYKQIFIEVENDDHTKWLYSIAIEYSEKFNTFRIEVSNTQADKDEEGNYPILYSLKILDTPDEFMFKNAVCNMLEFIKPYIWSRK